MCQHIKDFAKHPDSDFKGVIQASKGTVTVMAPFKSPEAFTRMWCLYEQFATLSARKTLDLYPPRYVVVPAWVACSPCRGLSL